MNFTGANLAFSNHGVSINQPIIFIHGFPYDSTMWQAQIEALKYNYYCVAYDIRGLGASPTGDGQYTMESFVDDLFELMGELNIINPVLCGLSMGGYIALRAVERSPSIFKALILCDTKAEADSNEGKIKRAEAIKKINKEGLEKFVGEFVRQCFNEESIEKLGEHFDKILLRSSAFNPAGVKGCLLAMAGRTDTTLSLNKIKIPTLLICGETDKLTPVEVMREMSKKIPKSELVVIPGAGHITPVESPAVFNKTILNFLEGLL